MPKGDMGFTPIMGLIRMSKSLGFLQATLTSRIAMLELSKIKPVVLAYIKEHAEHEAALLSHARVIYSLRRNHENKRK